MQTAFAAGFALALAVAYVEGAPRQESATDQPTPWQVQLGQRVANLESRLPVVDQVVLVPDAATYLDEIAKWSLQGRWPVLIEDDVYCPLFVRAFHPSRVIRRKATAALPSGATEREALVATAIAKAWTDRTAEKPSEAVATNPVVAFKAIGLTPAGVVFASMDDPAWTAAVALAAGRGQPISWLTGNYGSPESDLDAQRFADLEQRIEAGVSQLGLPWQSLGDPIDSITICRSMCAKTNLPAGTLAFGQSAPGEMSPDDSYALTDALGRNKDGSRWGVAGWIFGSEVRCAYAAMSSLFAPRETFWLVNSYGSDVPWNEYSMTDAAKICQERGWSPTLVQGDQVSVAGWLRLGLSGFAGDVLLVNTMGNWDFFQLFQRSKAFPEDIPVLDQPTALHMIHSWSLWQPNRADYIGGRWLDHGVYAYAGSVREPGLQAFVPPTQVVARLAAGCPFLIASRWGEGPFDRVWRITTVGDPLMIVEPPSGGLRRRIPPTKIALSADELDLRQLSTEALRRAKQGDVSAWGDAMRSLMLLGDDAIALKLWEVAKQIDASTTGAAAKPAQAASAPFVMGAQFRARGREELLAAYRLISSPSDLQRDMLWAAWTPYLGTVQEPVLLEFLGTQVRQRRPQVDLSRLAPELARLRSPSVARALVLDAAEHTDDAANKAALRELADSL